MARIEVIDLTKDYGHGRGVFDVSFNVEKGEVFGFLGPNGAGKTTTIRHIMGFSRPQKGATKVLGMDSFDNYYKIMDKVGYLPGEIALPIGLSGDEFLKMMQNLRKITDTSRTDYLLDRFKLNPGGTMKKMSLGDKRKLAIVSAFMHDPEILVLDEPTSGLDPIMQENFIDFIKEEKARGKTILLSSHIFREIDATCDRISIIKDGRIVDNFVASELKHSGNKVYAVSFKDSESFDAFAAKPFIFTAVDREGLSLKVSLPEVDTPSLIDYLADLNVEGFCEEQFSLQDYFMKFYDRRQNNEKR